MANWIPEDLDKAICFHLKNGNQIKIVMHVAKQTIRYKKEWDWTSESQFLKLLITSKVTFYTHMKYLLTRSILLSHKNGRKRLYKVNQDYASWGTINEDAYRKIFPSKGKDLQTKRLICLDEKGKGYLTPLYKTLRIIYTKDTYSPSGTPDVRIPLKDFSNWPLPILPTPEALEEYINQNTAGWIIDFKKYLLMIIAEKRLVYLHPDDIKGTIDRINKIRDNFQTEDEYVSYCVNALKGKWNDRLVKLDLEIHELRKRGKL